MGFFEGIVRIATGILLLIIVAGLVACQPPLFIGNQPLRLTRRFHWLKIMLDRIT